MLDVSGLTTTYFSSTGSVTAVDDVSFTVNGGEIVGIVGESGSGKSTLGRSLLRLIRAPGRIIAGFVHLGETDLLTQSAHAIRDVRGREIAMIFQNPMRSLHPSFTIGQQISEAIHAHSRTEKAEARRRTVEALGWVGIPDPESRLADYPHQFSGGMQQRVMIAMSLVNSPSVLVADEPTTALDVTIQAQILSLIRRLSDEKGMAVVFVTHDLGVVSQICDRVIVLYAGAIVEQGKAGEVLGYPRHPYTKALLAALPERATSSRLNTVSGSPPDLGDLPSGCTFVSRCPYACTLCETRPPLFDVSGHEYRCWVSEANGGHLPESRP